MMLALRKLSVQSLLLIAFASVNSLSVAQDFPPGEVIKYTFDQSKIFPGTTREVSIYVPAPYMGTEPACLYVNQDGIQFKATEVFDELIHKQQMPMTIGVFVTPGVVKSPSDKSLPRFNRSFEYDGLGDLYARFLIEELLPDVETKKTADGRAIVISKNPNDRAIAGSSSGAICAWTVAWERPDSFRRVYSAIGTYVGLRGGHNYSTLIRKYEPKPIRVFLEDGSNDLNIYGGDWWMANQAMERSLVFAGYEVTHDWGDGGHNGEHATQIFPDAMRWLWKDWPAPISTGKGSPQLQEILIPGEEWKVAVSGLQLAAGPTTNAKGVVFYNDVGTSKTFRLNPDSTPKEVVADSKRAEGQAFSPDGRLFSVAVGASQIITHDAIGRSLVVAEGIRGRDIVVLHDGSAYVTSPSSNGIDASKIWHINPKGERKIVDGGLKFASGVCASPDQSLLYVADNRSHWIYSYQIQKDGSLSHKQKYFHLHVPDTADDSGADGMQCDKDGRLWVATRIGLQVCDQPGRVNCIIPVPAEKVTDLTFGGDGMNTVYCTCGDRIFSRQVKVKGAFGWEQPSLPNKPRL